MGDQYHIDIEQYGLQRFKNNLKSRDLIPSRVTLKDGLDENFRVLELNGITNLKELIDTLKTKSKLERFAEETGLSVEYLTLYSFSMQNWKRPKDEVDFLMHLYASYLEGIRPSLMDNNVRLKHVGRRDPLPQQVLDALDETMGFLVEGGGRLVQRAVAGAAGAAADIGPEFVGRDKA